MPHKTGFRLAALILVYCAMLRAADVSVKVDWSKFLSSSDLVWTRLPTTGIPARFMGNGLLGANVFLDEFGKSLMRRIGRTDVTLNGSRIPIGELVLKTAGDLQGGNLRLDLWNAELDGTIRTTRGEIQIRSFTDAQQMVQVIEIQPDPGEESCQFEWHPGVAGTPPHRAKEPIPEDEKVLNPQLSENGEYICPLSRCSAAPSMSPHGRKQTAKIVGGRFC